MYVTCQWLWHEGGGFTEVTSCLRDLLSRAARRPASLIPQGCSVFSTAASLWEPASLFSGAGNPWPVGWAGCGAPFRRTCSSRGGREAGGHRRLATAPTVNANRVSSCCRRSLLCASMCSPQTMHQNPNSTLG